MLADITESTASQSLAQRNEELQASVQALTVKANTYKRNIFKEKYSNCRSVEIQK
jgi:hypothetical protein